MSSQPFAPSFLFERRPKPSPPSRPGYLRSVPQCPAEMLSSPVQTNVITTEASVHASHGHPATVSAPSPSKLLRARHLLAGLPLQLTDDFVALTKPLSFVSENLGVLFIASLLVLIPALATAVIYFELPGLSVLNPLQSIRGISFIVCLYLGALAVFATLACLCMEIVQGLRVVVEKMESRGAKFFRGEG
jgi:hypothetical protein